MTEGNISYSPSTPLSSASSCKPLLLSLGRFLVTWVGLVSGWIMRHMLVSKNVVSSVELSLAKTGTGCILFCYTIFFSHVPLYVITKKTWYNWPPKPSAVKLFLDSLAALHPSLPSGFVFLLWNVGFKAVVNVGFKAVVITFYLQQL